MIVPELENDSWLYLRHFNWGNCMNKHKVLKPSLGEERGPGIEAGWLVMRAFFLYRDSNGGQFCAPVRYVHRRQERCPRTSGECRLLPVA